jgi:hypothetical protein
LVVETASDRGSDESFEIAPKMESVRRRNLVPDSAEDDDRSQIGHEHPITEIDRESISSIK